MAYCFEYNLSHLINIDSILNQCCLAGEISGPGCLKLTTSLVNVSLKFQTNISSKPIFFVEKMCEAFALQKLRSFFQQKLSVYLVIKS